MPEKRIWFRSCPLTFLVVRESERAREKEKQESVRVLRLEREGEVLGVKIKIVTYLCKTKRWYKARPTNDLVF